MGDSRPAWFAVTGLGTTGGEATECDVPLERGVHLRWQPAQGIGFPVGGFDVLRRATLGGDEVCPDFDEALPAREGTRFTYADATVVASAQWRLEGRPRRGSLRLPGRQTLTITFDTPVRHVRIELGAGPAPATATAWWDGGGGARVDAATWPTDRRGEAARDLYADRIDRVVLTGVDLLVTSLCWLPEDQLDDTGWEPLSTVTVPANAVDAAARLPVGTPAEVVARYAAAYRDVRPLLVDLAANYHRQEAVVLTEPGASASGSRPAPDATWPVLDLLGAAAIDPLVARMLGLYWVDETAVDNVLYDYKVVGHWKRRPWPGRHITFEGLDVGATWTVLTHAGLVITSPRQLRSDVVDDAGRQRPSLRVAGSAALHAPISITWPDEPGPVRAITVRVLSDREVNLVTYSGARRTSGQPKTLAAGGGDITIEDRDGLTRLEILGGTLDLVELVLRPLAADVGDLEYISHRHAVRSAPAVRPSDVLSAQEVPLPPVADAGVTGEATTGAAVGLRWTDHSAGGSQGLLAGSPVRLLVHRGHRGDGDVPDSSQGFEVTNADVPTVFATSTTSSSHRRPEGWPDQSEPFGHVDHPPGPGWWEYAATGIDLFGRLAEQGRSATVRVTSIQPPPCPTNVRARWLDPADPHLAADDLAWAQASGPGVGVEWDWPGWAVLRCPQLDEGGASFRVHWLDDVAGGAAGAPTGAADPATYERVIATSPLPAPASGADGTVSDVVDLGDGYVRVRLDGLDAPFTPAGDDLPGVLATSGATWPARAHSEGVEVLLEVKTKPWLPALGRAARYRATKHLSLRIPLAGFAPAAGAASAHGWVAVSTQDGEGRESCASAPARVEVVDRRIPEAPTIASPAERLWAPPADYFGRSTVALTWAPAPDAAAYVVLRASLAALLTTGTLEHPDPADPSDPAQQADYDAAVRALAAQASAEAVFRSVSAEQVASTTFNDTIDGRGRGAYVWRVRSVSVAGVLGPTSEPIGPVWVTPVTPPPIPVVTSAVGGDRAVVLQGRAGGAAGSPATTCRVYRAADAASLLDVRRAVPLGEVPVTDGQWRFDDPQPTTASALFYAVTAVDGAGNASAPTPAVQARAVDVQPPAGPAVEQLAWSAAGVSLVFTPPPEAQVLVERREATQARWQAASAWLVAVAAFEDVDVDPARSYAYRLLARTPNGVVGEPGPQALAQTELTL